MTNHEKHADKHAGQQNGADDPETAQKLLSAAAGGQWLKGYDKDMTAQLQKDGVLAGSDTFDPTKVKTHLASDQQAHQTGGAALDQLHKHNTDRRQAIDASKAADQAFSKDFQTVDGTLHEMMKATHKDTDPLPFKTTITKADVQALAHNGKPEAKAAAQRLLDNWDKNPDFTGASAEANSPAAMRNKVDPFMNHDTLTRGMIKHDHARAGQEKDLAQSVAREQDMRNAQERLEQVMKLEQLSLSATDKFIAAAKLQAGNGYYQAADRMLSLDGSKHTEAERKMMTKLLQQHLADSHDGKIPQVLTWKDISLSTQSVDKLFVRINDIADKVKSKNVDSKGAAGLSADKPHLSTDEKQKKSKMPKHLYLRQAT